MSAAGDWHFPEAAHEFVFHLRERLDREKDFAVHGLSRALQKVWQEYFDDFLATSGCILLYELVVSIYNRFRASHAFPPMTRDFSCICWN